jgi:hypothetical protein
MLSITKAETSGVTDVVGIGRIEEEEKDGGWSYSATVPCGTVHA